MPAATPMTAAMEMYNWLRDKQKKKGQKDVSSPMANYLQMLSPQVKQNYEAFIERLVDRIVSTERADNGDNS